MGSTDMGRSHRDRGVRSLSDERADEEIEDHPRSEIARWSVGPSGNDGPAEHRDAMLLLVPVAAT